MDGWMDELIHLMIELECQASMRSFGPGVHLP